MKDNRDTPFMLIMLFAALALLLVALYINKVASETAQRCIENGGQWVQVTKDSFTCIMPK